jgi:superfamily II DNA helicase RecQ
MQVVIACFLAGTEAGRSKAELLKMLKPGGCLGNATAVVVYTTFQLRAEDTASYLHSHGITAAAYHAGKHIKVRPALPSYHIHDTFALHAFSSMIK